MDFGRTSNLCLSCIDSVGTMARHILFLNTCEAQAMHSHARPSDEMEILHAQPSLAASSGLQPRPKRDIIALPTPPDRCNQGS